jgi:hypothetical protein
MNRRGSRHGFETRFVYALARRYPRGFTFYVADPLSCIHEFILMIKQVALRRVTVGSGPVCDEKRAT